MDRGGPVQLLANGHDAILFQVPEDQVHTLMPEVKKRQEIPIEIKGVDGKVRTLVIPSDAQVGWNWGKHDPKKKTFDDGNPNGLRDYEPEVEYRKAA
jgi:hypothetical protein